MIRKLIILLLLISTVFCCIGCSTRMETFEEPVTFYYPEQPQPDGAIGNVIHYEIREGKDISGKLHIFLDAYLNGPESSDLYSPFPASVTLVDASVQGEKAELVFNDAFALLSGIERSIACACISMTCMDFTGTETVEIYAQNALFDGEEKIIITRDNIYTEDTALATEP